MADIFISYASEDRPRVAQLQALLLRCGWSVWWDHDIPAGYVFRLVISEELESARCIVVAWSRSSIASRWVIEEAENGLRHERLIPILLDDVNPPLGFGELQAILMVGFDGKPSSPAFSQLVASLQHRLGPVPNGVPDDDPAAGASEGRRVQDDDWRRVQEYFARLLEYDTGLPAMVMKMVRTPDGDVDTSVFAANTRAHEMFGLNQAEERLVGMRGAELLDRLKMWMSQRDLQLFLVDQQRIYEAYVLRREFYAGAPMVFDSRHPNSEFRLREYVPVVFAYSGEAQTGDRTERLVGVLYLDLARLPAKPT